MAVSHVFSNAVADWTGTVTVFDSAGNTGTAAASAIVRPSDWNSAHNQFYTLTGNTTGNTTASGTNVIFAGSGGITLGGSTDTIVVSGPLISDLAFNSNNVQPGIAGVAAQQNNSSVSIFPIFLPNPMVFSNLRVFASLNVGSAANNSSAYVDASYSAVFYTRNGSTLSSVTSMNGTTTASWSSNNTGNMTGVVMFNLTCNVTTLPAAEYYVAAHFSTNNTATGGANTTALGNSVTMMVCPLLTNNINPHFLGIATNASIALAAGAGILSTGATRASLAFSDYAASNSVARHALLYGELRNGTYQ